ncbi:hypothetical protein L7F22_013888 [Adiantum nelumboides]|nr:hypothetical protein [Adiantum nelumboides]
MGAHFSCMYADLSSSDREPILGNSSHRVLKVVLAYEGRTCEFSEPVKVAELMLDFPNHFVAEFLPDNIQHVPSPASATTLRQEAMATAAIPVHSKRVSPLPADHDAQLSHVYLLLPMHRLNTRLSADELNVISALAATPTATPQCMSPSRKSRPHVDEQGRPSLGKGLPRGSCRYI